MIDAVRERGGVAFRIRHCANSGAVVNYPEMALDMVRPGLLLYGYGDGTGRLGLRPCMRLVTTVSTIKLYEPGTCVSYGRRFTTERRTRMACSPSAMPTACRDLSPTSELRRARWLCAAAG